ncbi:MAG: ABC transporter substrate-binding protein [Deltaproteobacteria bacterium]|nr:ABC transporter substrate-binding protein [Deltaproteobacteria bacterium]
MVRSQVRGVFVLLALVSLVMVPSSLLAAEALSKFRLVQSGHTAMSWPIYVGKDQKFFEKNGLDFEETIIRGATNTTRAVLSNTVPVGRINPDYVITAMEKGAKVKIISGSLDKIPYNLMARPEIKSGADLKGKTIGVSSLSGGTTLMLHEIMEKAFKLKENDYKLLVVGTSPDRYAALKGGSVQATFMGPPFNIRAKKEGYTDLAVWHDILGPIQFVSTFAHNDYLKSHREDTVKYIKSIIQATQWLYDPKNKEQAIALHMKILKSKPDIAESDYKYVIEDFKPFSPEGELSEAGMKKTMELRVADGMYKGKKVPSWTDFVDNSYVEEAKKQLGMK